MKLSNLSKLTAGMTDEEIAEFKKAVEGSTVLRDALVKVLQPKLNAVESKLQDVEALANTPNVSAYVLSLLQARTIYQHVLDLLK